MRKKDQKDVVKCQMLNVKCRQSGFTLIETIIYLFLFAIVIGGGMVAAYQIIEGTNATYNHVILQEEANLLFRKIDWALTGLDGASSINTPSTCTPSPCTSSSNTDLIITKDGTSHSFCLVGTNLFLQLNSGCSASSPGLNSSSTAVSLTPSIPLFERIVTPGKPNAIKTSFTLTTIQGGKPATQDFSFTKYLRR